jgi:hypothetical protein
MFAFLAHLAAFWREMMSPDFWGESEVHSSHALAHVAL